MTDKTLDEIFRKAKYQFIDDFDDAEWPNALKVRKALGGCPIHIFDKAMMRFWRVAFELGKTAGRKEKLIESPEFELLAEAVFKEREEKAKQAGRDELMKEMEECMGACADKEYAKVHGHYGCYPAKIAELLEKLAALEAELSLCQDVARAKNLMDAKKIGTLAVKIHTKKLREENARLRDALNKISKDCSGCECISCICCERAKMALEGRAND